MNSSKRKRKDRRKVERMIKSLLPKSKILRKRKKIANWSSKSRPYLRFLMPICWKNRRISLDNIACLLIQTIGRTISTNYTLCFTSNLI
jgi:hypothetical protein